MAKQGDRSRSALVPLSVNAFLGHAFNACIETPGFDDQELDPGLLRFTRLRVGTENVLSPAVQTKYYQAVQNQNSLRRESAIACAPCSPIVVSRWSPEPGIPTGGRILSNFNSPITSMESVENAFGSSSPPSGFSAFRTPMKTPLLKIPTYSPAQLVEDVLVMDGFLIKESFTPPEQPCPKTKVTTPDSPAGSANIVSPNSLYKTEICRSWEEFGTCRYGLKCQFAHGKDDLRPAARHPKYKTEICRAFTATGTCPYGTRCRFIHRLNLSNSNGDELKLPAHLDDLLEYATSSNRDANRTPGRRLPIFQQICPVSPPSPTLS